MTQTFTSSNESCLLFAGFSTTTINTWKGSHTSILFLLVIRFSFALGKQTSAGPLKIVYFSSIQEGKNNSNLQILCIVSRAVEASILKETAILRRSLKLIRKKHYAIYTTEIMEENESVVYKCETENEIERVAKRKLVKVEGWYFMLSHLIDRHNNAQG